MADLLPLFDVAAPPRTFIVFVIGPCKWLNANERHSHWSQRSGPTAQWREEAGDAAAAADVPALERASITAIVHRTDRRTDCDSHNRYPTIKAAVDGLVDAGVLPDDCDRYLMALTTRAGEQLPKTEFPHGVLELIITEEALVARIRTLKPGFFKSRSLSKLPRDARTTFAGMWCEADDHGRGVADARLLKGAIWPLDDDLTFLHVSAFVDMLAASNHIRLYQVDGEAYYEIVNWTEHQAAAYRRGDPKYPPVSAGQPLESLAAHESVQESAGRTQVSAGTGNREQGTGNRDSTADAVREPEATIFDETPLAEVIEAETVEDDTETSTAVAVVEEVGAGQIVAHLIDQSRERGIELPDQIIKRFGKQIKQQLKQYPPDLIWRAIVLMSHENVLDSPELLPKKIVAVQSGPRRPPTTQKRSATDEAVEGWLALADQIGEAA